MGKALSWDTPILTTNGFKSMESIEIGDYVYDEKGNPVKVTNKTIRQENRECFSVKFAHGEEIVADAEHLWIIDSNGKTKTVTTREIKTYMDVGNAKASKNRKRIKVRKSTSVELPSQEVPVDPYTMGLWLGDGFSKASQATVHIDDAIEYAKHCDITLGKFRKDSTTCIDFKFNQISTSQIKQLGLFNNKHILPEYIYNSKSIRLELLRGLMDSDGTVEKNGVCRFYQSDLSFIQDVRILLSTLGIKSTLRSKETGFKTAYTLCFVYNDEDIFKLPRKLNRQYKNKSHPKNDFFYIKSVDDTEPRDVYCIEVENESHLFLAGKTLIPTHNCVMGETLITVRNKSTGEVKSVTMEEFHNMVK